MRKEELKNWTREQMKEEILRLTSSNEILEKESKRMAKIIEQYEKLPFSDDEIDYDALISELQDQHQQDCIRYNDMRTAYLVTVDELARLREQFGVGR